MRVRRIAVLIDGGFFLKRLPKVVEERFRNTPEAVAETARILCKRHVGRLTDDERWLDHVYRIFYYDALPFEGKLHHPVTNTQIDFGRSDAAVFRRALFDALRCKRKFALRLGEVARDPASDWAINARKIKKIVGTHAWHARFSDPPRAAVSEEERAALGRLEALWRGFSETDVTPTFRQKGVDMRLGIDITSLALKRQADTIVLVTGDSDFVPAAKLARREGVEIVLDPMRQSIRPDLHEHIDGLTSVLGVQAENEGDD